MPKDAPSVVTEAVRAELADLIQEAREENITLIRYNSDTGEAWKVSPDGTIEPYEMVSETDWERVNAMTDEEIEAVDISDEGLPGDWLDDREVLRLHGRIINGKQVNGKHG